MRTIAVVTQKGGTGKSTIAIAMAVAAMEDGHRVALIEADPQGTALKWYGRRENCEPPLYCVNSEAEIAELQFGLAQEGFTLAIVDTAATKNRLSDSAISNADFCLVPARPSAADIEAALPTLRLIRQLGKRFAFVLNQAPARSYRLSEAAALLSSVGVLALPYIVLRNDHIDALAAGLAVTELAPDGKAAEEIRGLWHWLREQLIGDSFEDDQIAMRVAG